jgi:hypothetical protein
MRGYQYAKADLELEKANSRHERGELHCEFDDRDMPVAKIRLRPEDRALH